MIDLEAIKANRREYQSSTVMLIAANVFPLLGVIFWGWSIFDIVVLYWLENLMVGVINILRMIVCSPDPEQVDLSKPLRKMARNRESLTEEDRERLKQAEDLVNEHGGKLGIAHHASKLFLVPFFTVHYGLFCLVHGVFVFVLLGGESPLNGPGPDLGGMIEMIGEALRGGAVWAALALFASHLFSFFVNFIGKGEFRRTVIPLLMFAPYGRIVVLHIAILFGAFVIILLGSPIFLLVLLIAGKIFLDLGLHLWSHTRLATKNKNPGEA